MICVFFRIRFTEEQIRYEKVQMNLFVSDDIWNEICEILHGVRPVRSVRHVTESPRDEDERNTRFFTALLIPGGVADIDGMNQIVITDHFLQIIRLVDAVVTEAEMPSDIRLNAGMRHDSLNIAFAAVGEDEQVIVTA